MVWLLLAEGYIFNFDIYFVWFIRLQAQSPVPPPVQLQNQPQIRPKCWPQVRPQVRPPIWPQVSPPRLDLRLDVWQWGCIVHSIFTSLKERSILSPTLHKKWSFPLRISSANMTKSAVSCRFGYTYWRNPLWKTSFFVQCNIIL